MLKRLAALPLLAAAALALAPSALAAGGRYTFDGGTAAERGQVVKALDASSFPWGLLPGTVVVHIGAVPVSRATPGQVWLDAGLLDSGRFSWGVVQHEFAHEVDFLLLDAAARARLAPMLGDADWWGAGYTEHSDLGCERFASTLAWAFWPAGDNAMRPSGPNDEAGHVAPSAFRAALAAVLPGAVAQPAEALRTTADSHPKRRGH
ncbi:MAG TPA: hypothetical protein VFJ77_00975 [Gaiellaceae bacterium]|nr:hypothetical protein [Gaiellaceae bacterium]